MIDRIRKGNNVTTLLYYLYGPGKSDEHTDPHLVAGWRDPLASLEPPIRPDGKRDFTPLSRSLNAPLAAAGRHGQNGTVWHCVLSAAPADRLLSDGEWNAIATEFTHQMGLARRDDPAGVRWVAVRHGLSKGGIDHVHIAATLARQDGKLPSVHNDFVRARRACQAIERQFGLTVTAPADRTAAVRPSRAEAERSARIGWAEPPRIALRRMVQEAAAVAVSEADFFTRLRDAGALIRERRNDPDPERIAGYAVGLPGYTTRSGEPVWFGGGKLAPDLTLPRLRRRWEHARNSERLRVAGLSERSARALLRGLAERAADHAQDERSFFMQLSDQGVQLRLRHSERDPGEATGYAVTLPGHVDTTGAPVWYPGGRLGAGLTLPSLRRRWQAGQTATRPACDPAERQAAWADITRVTADSAARFAGLLGSDQQAAADLAMATADALRVSARTASGQARDELRRAAGEFDRAAREAFGITPLPTAAGQTLRTAARIIAVTSDARGSAVGRLGRVS